MPGRSLNLPSRADIRRILIMRWSAMGDVVLASAAMQAVCEAFPHASIHLNTLPPWNGLFVEDPRFDDVIAIDLRGPRAGPAAMWRWLWRIRRNRYDLIIDLQSSDRSRLLLALLRLSGGGPAYSLGNFLAIPYRLGPAGWRGARHALEYHRATLAAGGIPMAGERPVLRVGAPRRRRVARLLHDHSVTGDYAILLPGCQAAGYLKRWGARRFIALARQLHRIGVPRVVLAGAAHDAGECRRIAAECGSWLVNLCGKTELADLVPLCDGARFIVANDTGPGHVAAGAAKPMVVICGPTDPRRVKPPGDNVVALQAALFCVNCYRKECSHHSCMQLVTPERVVETLGRLGALP